MISLLASFLLVGTVPSVARDAMDFRFTVCGVPHQFENRKIDWEFDWDQRNLGRWVVA